MAIRSNKFRIGIGLVVIGTGSPGAAMATLYRPRRLPTRRPRPCHHRRASSRSRQRSRAGRSKTRPS